MTGLLAAARARARRRRSTPVTMTGVILRDAIWPRPADPPETPRLGHVVTTRYAMRIYRENTPREDRSEFLTWLRHRTEVFRTVCLPSVLSQTRKPSRWLLGLDGTNRGDFDELLELIEPYSWIEPVWQEENDTFHQPFVRRLRKLPASWEAVATTRVDNDDALAVTYLNQVHHYSSAVFIAEPEITDFWIAFTHGAQLVEGALHTYMHPSPHFLTRVMRLPWSDAHKASSSMAINHGRLRDDPDRRVFLPLSSQPMWLQNVHGQNVSNRIQQRAVRLDRREFALFGLDHEAFEHLPDQGGDQ